MSKNEVLIEFNRLIVDELITVIPDNWDSLLLHIGYSKEADVESFPMTISSPEGHREVLSVPESLFLIITEMFDFYFVKYEKPWINIQCEVSYLEKDDSWKYEFRYT